MSRSVLPDPPNKFSSYESWIKLSNSALSRWQVLWNIRDSVLNNLDGTIAFHEREHARLTAVYEEERQRYLMAHVALGAVIPGSDAERDLLRIMCRHLQAVVRAHDKLIDGRRKVERKFEAWMDLQGFDGRPKGRDANRKLSQRRLRMRQERQDALNDRLVLGNMLASISRRLEECDRPVLERTPEHAVTAHESSAAYKSIGELSEFLARLDSAAESDVVADHSQAK